MKENSQKIKKSHQNVQKNAKKEQNDEKQQQFCSICPRACNINRSVNLGFCAENEDIRIAKIIPHFSWEEPCLAEKNGTLAIFFSGCNLKCDYCQNHAISRGGIGKKYSIEDFIELIETNQLQHDSIDLITPTHFSKSLEKAFEKINKKVPVIWNTNGFETRENIAKVSKFVDIFLTDFKYTNNNLAKKFSACEDYFTYALDATKEMCTQKPDEFCGDQMTQGVIIRHLVLPGYVKNSLEVLDILKENFANRKISIMSQFTPNGKSQLNRKITPLEYKLVLTHMQNLGLSNGFIQDFESACNDFVPDFNLQ